MRVLLFAVLLVCLPAGAQSDAYRADLNRLNRIRSASKECLAINDHPEPCAMHAGR